MSPSTKLEVSTPFVFRENRRHGTNGRTDGQTDSQTDGETDGRCATLNAASMKGRIISKSIRIGTVKGQPLTQQVRPDIISEEEDYCNGRHNLAYSLTIAISVNSLVHYFRQV